MGLRDRLKKRPEPATGSFATPRRRRRPGRWPTLPGAQTDSYHELKHELHHKLIEKIDLATIDKLPREQLRDELRLILNQLLATSELPLNRVEREQMVEELLDEVTGLGPLEPLLADTTISDIMVNGFNICYIERFGKLELTQVRFRDNAHLQQIILRIVSRVGRRIDESSPMADARLPDGARVNAIIPPLAIDGPVLSIRRFGGSPLRVKDMIAINSATPEMLAFLAACVKAKLNMPDLGRYRHRQDDDAQRPVVVHPRERARHHHRGRRRAPAPAEPRRPAGDAARRTSRARARSSRATGARTPCVCGPTASSSASAAAARCWTCCRR